MKAATAGSGVSITSGGYFKLGNLVIINLRLNVTTAVTSGNTIVSGFPAYTGTTRVSCVNNRNLDIAIQTNGKILCSATVPTGVLVLDAVYCVTT